MKLFAERLFILVAIISLTARPNLSAFSLNGPAEIWQTPELGFTQRQKVGPKNLGEEFRLNVPVVTYGFDHAFLQFFGQHGVSAVDRAVKLLNDLPSANDIDPNTFPRDTRRLSLRGQGNHLIDLKTTTLSLLLQQLGLSSAERWVWTVRTRSITEATTNYVIVNRSFDPTTWLPSPYVNGTRYTYQVVENFESTIHFADAVEVPLDPEFSYSSVAGILERLDPGIFVTGLTQDDAGGIRYLLHPSNLNLEPIWPSTASVMNVEGVLRPGVNKILFRKIPSTWFSTPNWNEVLHFNDRFFAGDKLQEVGVSRTITRPDIVFSVFDSTDHLVSISDPIFIKSAQPAQQTDQAGPGIIQPGTTIRYAKLTGQLLNQFPGNTSEATGLPAKFPLLWASFDNNPIAPLTYPISYQSIAGSFTINQSSTSEGQQVKCTFVGEPFTTYELQKSKDLRRWAGGIWLSNATGVHQISIPTDESIVFFRAFRSLQVP